MVWYGMGDGRREGACTYGSEVGEECPFAAGIHTCRLCLVSTVCKISVEFFLPSVFLSKICVLRLLLLPAPPAIFSCVGKRILLCSFAMSKVNRTIALVKHWPADQLDIPLSNDSTVEENHIDKDRSLMLYGKVGTEMGEVLGVEEDSEEMESEEEEEEDGDGDGGVRVRVEGKDGEGRKGGRGWMRGGSK